MDVVFNVVFDFLNPWKMDTIKLQKIVFYYKNFVTVVNTNVTLNVTRKLKRIEYIIRLRCLLIEKNC